MSLRWLDLFVGDDSHPRRFDSRDRLLKYLRRIERLDEVALEEIDRRSEVGPPLARLIYRIVPLAGDALTQAEPDGEGPENPA